MPVSLNEVPRRPTLVATVIHQIKAYITDAALGPGDRLPTQDVLTRELGVSRTVVREAVKSLETMGIIESRHGDGVFIRSFDPRPIADSLTFGFDRMNPVQRIEYLFEARELFEIGMLDVLKERMTQSDRVKLHQILHLLKEAGNNDRPYLDLDYQFHRTLLEAAHNPILTRFGDTLHEVFRLLGRYPESSSKEELEDIVQRHEVLYDAVCSGDIEKARRAMHDHILESKKRWLRALDLESLSARR